MRIAKLIDAWLIFIAMPAAYLLCFIRLSQGEFEEALIWFIRVWVLSACWVIVKGRDKAS